MSGAIRMHRNRLADMKADEGPFKPRPASLWDAVSNFMHPGVYCVRRCDFFKGNFSIHSKTEMETKREYKKPWLAYEGTYTECRQFVSEKQQYFPLYG